MRKDFLMVLMVLFSKLVYTQTCDCKTNFEWVKETFEKNDAGFQYALKTKGEQAYNDHNIRTLNKVQGVKTLNECTPILYEWLQFFRSGHIGIKLNEQAQQTNASKPEVEFQNWETYNIKTEDFKKYLDKKTTHDYEGIWETGVYKIGIKKEGESYVGFIIESGVSTWTKGQVKLKLSVKGDVINSVFYLRNHSAVESNSVTLIGKNILQVGNFTLSRIYPKLADEPKYSQYYKAINANQPYIEQLDETTLYFRVPSFDESFKSRIDSVVDVNKNKILTIKNLIIDIRNNGGGSDASYSSITPFLYTNPIRVVGVEYLSTKLNNQRMLDFINNPEYGFDDEGKKWARESYEKLQSKLGQFVSLEENKVSLDKRDTIYSYPQNVGVIINGGNASTAEQFLLEAKQSKKVKLFGVTTSGILDISNMYFVDSPCKEFQLGYSLSRSMRIPDFTIDEKGIQPDYYLDKTIPLYDWTDYVNKFLNGE